MPYSFNSRDVAVKLRDFANAELPSRQRQFRPGAFHTVMVKTPSAGIAARSSIGSTEDDRNEFEMGNADCEVLTTYTSDGTDTARLDTDTVRTINQLGVEDAGVIDGSSADAWKTEAGTNPTNITVHNPYPYWIEGERIIQAAFINGSWVVHNDGNATRIFLTPAGGIPARSGTTLGKATCTGYKLTFDGTDADLATAGFTADVFNMAIEAVGASAYIQAIMFSGLWVANWEQC